MNKIEISRRTAIIISTVILLIVLVPFTLLSFFFFKYRTTIMSLTGSPIKVKKTGDQTFISKLKLNKALKDGKKLTLYIDQNPILLFQIDP